MTSSSTDRSDAKVDEAARLLAEMRASVEEATSRLDALTAELTASHHAVDVLETVVEVLLEVADRAVVIIDADRRITGLARGAAERFDGAAVGKPLSSILPEVAADRLVEHAEGAGPREVDLLDGRPPAVVHPLPGGGAVVVLPTQ